MSTHTHVQQQQPAQDPRPSEMRAPWERDETLPEITFTYRQNDRGRWFCDRSVVINSLDPFTEEGTQQIFEILDRVDAISREHMTQLYAKDAEDRDRYFREREAQGGYSNNWNQQR